MFKKHHWTVYAMSLLVLLLVGLLSDGDVTRFGVGVILAVGAYFVGLSINPKSKDAKEFTKFWGLSR